MKIISACLQMCKFISIYYISIIPDRYRSVPIFVTEKVWNAPILKVILGVSDSYLSTQKPNENISGTIIGYNFEFK